MVLEMEVSKFIQKWIVFYHESLKVGRNANFTMNWASGQTWPKCKI
jgi:hypothetical protein